MKCKNYVISLFFFSIVLIYLLSIAPAQTMPETNDKFNHIVGFLYLSVLGRFVYKTSYIVLGLLLYGIFIEISQLFVPGRSCEFLDVVADGIGISFGVLVSNLFKKRK